MVSDYVDMDVPASFGDNRLNSGRIIRLFVRPPVFCTCVQYLITFCNRPEAASDVIFGRFVRPTVLDKRVFSDPTIVENFHPKLVEAVFSSVVSPKVPTRSR